MNLALLWRGGFIDAALHWIDRGGGEQPTSGLDEERPCGDSSVPFAILDSAEAAWPVPDKKTAKALATGYDWKGYRLDTKRFPTFSYVWKGVKVTDRFDTIGAAESGGTLIRTLNLTGAIPAKSYMREAAGNLQPDRNGLLVDGGLHVSVSGAKIVGNNLLVPARKEIKINYSWPEPKNASAP